MCVFVTFVDIRISRKTKKQIRETALYVQQACVCHESSDAAGKQLSQKIVWKFCQDLLDWVAQPPTLTEK